LGSLRGDKREGVEETLRGAPDVVVEKWNEFMKKHHSKGLTLWADDSEVNRNNICRVKKNINTKTTSYNIMSTTSCLKRALVLFLGHSSALLFGLLLVYHQSLLQANLLLFLIPKHWTLEE
jgi:hypothetical protein